MIIFKTPRLIVRTLLDTDFPHIFRLQSDPVTMRYIRAPVTDEQPVRERMMMWETYRENCPGLGVFAVEHKAGGDFAGYVTARHVDFKPETGEYEIGYVIAPEWQGQGLVSEVVPPLCRYLFDLSGAQKIVAFTDPENAVSQRVLLKCGFIEVGMRQVYEGKSKEFWLEM
ncbi:MAG TPA: GNAT family N-acetyltransferase [Saprospiraceae bacterium]|nr:GNAT family N-acetyltransferase [Saprospiraceae bacterium]